MLFNPYKNLCVKTTTSQWWRTPVSCRVASWSYVIFWPAGSCTVMSSSLFSQDAVMIIDSAGCNKKVGFSHLNTSRTRYQRPFVVFAILATELFQRNKEKELVARSDRRWMKLTVWYFRMKSNPVSDIKHEEKEPNKLLYIPKCTRRVHKAAGKLRSMLMCCLAAVHLRPITESQPCWYSV